MDSGRSSLAVCALFTSCTPIGTIELPPTSSRAGLLAIERDGEAPVVEAFAGGKIVLTRTIEPGAKLIWVTFEHALEEYQLAPGLVAVTAEGGRPFPRPFDAFTRTAGGAQWTELDPATALEHYRLPVLFDPLTCAEARRCLIDGRCVEECPVPPAPVPPMRPESGEVTPCLPGWVLTDDQHAYPYCEPFPPLGDSTCPPDQVRFPGDAACAPIGPCDTSFAADLPVGREIIYVSSTSTAVPGDGSRARPFATITEALSTAAPSSIIALAPGNYPAPAVLSRPVELYGACPTGTIIHGSIETAHELTLRRLTIANAAAAIRALDSISLEVEDVVVEDGMQGILVAGARARLERVVVRRMTQFAIFATLGADLVARDIRIEDIGGDGLVVALDCTADLARVHAVALSGRAPDAGAGIVSNAAANIAIRASVIERAHFSGIAIGAAGSALIEDTLIRDTEQVAPRNGHGLDLIAVRTAHLERVALLRNRGHGISVRSSTVTLRNVITSCTEREPGDEAGLDRGGGLTITEGSRVTGDHFRSQGDLGAGLGVLSSTVSLEHVIVDRRCGGGGRGEAAIFIGVHANVALSRVDVIQAQANALVVNQMTPKVHVTDLYVGSTKDHGIAIECDQLAGVTCLPDVLIERALLEDADESSVLVDHADGVRFVDLEINHARRQIYKGSGVEVRELGTASVERFAIHGCSSAAYLRSGNALSFRDGRVHDNTVAIELFDSRAAYDGLFDGVLYEDNIEMILRP